LSRNQRDLGEAARWREGCFGRETASLSSVLSEAMRRERGRTYRPAPSSLANWRDRARYGVVIAFAVADGALWLFAASRAITWKKYGVAGLSPITVAPPLVEFVTFAAVNGPARLVETWTRYVTAPATGSQLIVAVFEVTPMTLTLVGAGIVEVVPELTVFDGKLVLPALSTATTWKKYVVFGVSPPITVDVLFTVPPGAGRNGPVGLTDWSTR
jgi:hypothetical protein